MYHDPHEIFFPVPENKPESQMQHITLHITT